MLEICEIEIEGKKEIYEFGKVAKQSNGSVLVKKDNAVILASVACEYDNPGLEDFTPLTVQYIEKTYAAAKIPGGFIKREGKPSDYETLTSRIIDRSLRPLFPSGFNYPTTITVMVLSGDSSVDFQVLALNAASAALYTSDLPITKFVSGMRVAKIGEEICINPSMDMLKKSTLDLYLTGAKSELLMIEMQSLVNEENSSATDYIDEEKLIDIISNAQESITQINTLYESRFDNVKKEKIACKLYVKEISAKLLDFIRTNYTSSIEQVIEKLAKKERSIELKDLADNIFQDSKLQDLIPSSVVDIYEAIQSIKKEIVRDKTIHTKKRADGRALDEVRSIEIEMNLLPSAHSSCLFTRGDTQALVISTIGNEKDAQMYEILSEKATLSEKFMVHYNFPGFSVGEAKPILGVSRRELGHGNLAKKALQYSINKTYDETIRLVSEILESNGSSSMATVCAGSLALKAANIPINSLVAGIAMGAMFDGEKYVILSDITGLEDHDGDMDFKIAGTKNSITALQMDIKLGGISLVFLKEALLQARNGRIHILNIMENASEDIIPSLALPLMEQFSIDTSKTFAVIGKGGSTIREIIETCSVSIDIDKNSGLIKITGKTKPNIEQAKEMINSIITRNSNEKNGTNFKDKYSVDEIVSGTVIRIADFGAFIKLKDDDEGLLHISKIAKERVNKVEDVLSIGQQIDIKVLSVSHDRIELINPLI